MGNRTRVRRAGITMTVVAAGLVPLVLCATLVLLQARANVADADRRAARERASAAAVQLAQLFDQWRTELLVAGNNRVLVDWYTHPGERRGMRPDLNRLLVQLYWFYPDLIDEACFIDAGGPELARQVRGVPAPPPDLSPDESGNPFFRPTFAVGAGRVHQHGPYISPDSGRWVISNSTPLVVGGRAVALLHFEASLEGVRQRLRQLLGPQVRGWVVDTAGGNIVVDLGGAPIGKEGFARAAGRHLPGVTAAAAVRGGADNQNQWRVQVAVAPTSAWRGADLSRLALLILLTVAGLVVLAMSFTRRLVRPIARITEIARRLAAGDLTQRIDLSRDDEVGVMAAAVNDAARSLQDAMAEIAHEADDLARYAQELEQVGTGMVSEASATAAKADDLLTDARQVAEHMDAVRTSTEAVRSSVAGVAEHATEAARVADTAASVTDRVAQTIERLGASSAEIGDVLEVIAGIAAQTNLLALNATIEAARAGETGKGFAVVASEVQELARETAAATEQITGTITSLRADATDATRAMDDIRTVITEIRTMQGAIVEAVRSQQTAAAEISDSTVSAARGSAAISAHIDALTRSAGSTTEGATAAQEAAERLATMAKHLHDLLQNFTYSRPA